MTIAPLLRDEGAHRWSKMPTSKGTGFPSRQAKLNGLRAALIYTDETGLRTVLRVDNRVVVTDAAVSRHQCYVLLAFIGQSWNLLSTFACRPGQICSTNPWSYLGLLRDQPDVTKYSKPIYRVEISSRNGQVWSCLLVQFGKAWLLVRPSCSRTDSMKKSK